MHFLPFIDISIHIDYGALESLKCLVCTVLNPWQTPRLHFSHRWTAAVEEPEGSAAAETPPVGQAQPGQ